MEALGEGDYTITNFDDCGIVRGRIDSAGERFGVGVVQSDPEVVLAEGNDADFAFDVAGQ